MPAPQILKQTARRLGLYYPARRLYRAFSRDIANRLQGDAQLYGTVLKSGCLVFDIGCHMGDKARVFLELGARVVGVEPNPNCHRELTYQFSGNDRFTMVCAAIGDAEGDAVLNFSGAAASSSLRSDWDALKYNDGPMDKMTVRVTTLDRLIADYGRPDFCKIDVEGFELPVLAGLSEPPPLLSFEFVRHELDRSAQCMRRLEMLGATDFNFISMNGTSFEMQDWSTGDDVIAALGKSDASINGDVFARC